MSTFRREDLRRVLFLDLSEQVTELLLHELCTQFGEVARINWQVTTNASGAEQRSNVCFVDFWNPDDAKYCFEALHNSQTRLFDKEVRVAHHSLELAAQESGRGSTRSSAIHGLHEIGALVAVRNVDVSATEYEVASFFEQFGAFAAPPRMWRDAVGNFRGVVVISYADFSFSDRAIAEMDGKVFRDRSISVQYAELRDGSGRMHGSEEERRNAEVIKEEERKYRETLAAAMATAKREEQTNRERNTSWAQNVDLYGARR